MSKLPGRVTDAQTHGQIDKQASRQAGRLTQTNTDSNETPVRLIGHRNYDATSNIVSSGNGQQAICSRQEAISLGPVIEQGWGMFRHFADDRRGKMRGQNETCKYQHPCAQ